mgnify:CR=1 FL=1
MKIHNILFGSGVKSISTIIEEGNLDELNNFIKTGGDVNAKYDDKSLLHFAIDNCGNNYFKVIECLVNNGSDVSSYQSYLKETPLHRICARVKPKIDVVELLLDRGTKVNAENISGRTPVFYCNFSYSVELLKLLVKYGADIKHTDKYNNTLLHDDYLDCNTETFEDFIKVLISLDFNINSKNNVGHTPLYLCENKYIENILIKYGGKISL